ncbi:probable E3 SUMO-protein ligase RNF212 isoform X2 [Nannospalax galili]|uniref:probable E3 SUMO-protein ligase RNF212 isoform X2 n=1 Tax=Nannospalax galili TaxID=1026970 RepID=UPI00111C70AA|nr:probable E3 SUMO-protein ligase RNF212 isoform X2 [Nannospalax galili]
MASWVFCNRCFQPPHRKSSFSLTSCGHVYCDACLRQGKKNECLICRAPCHTVLLSKQTDSSIQALFLGIDGLCKKYSQETSQISEFQEKHRKRLLAFYREKISHLEESLRKSVLQIEQLQSMRSSQQAAFSTMKNSVSTKPNGYLMLPPTSSVPDRIGSMEIELTTPTRKPEMAVGPSRISLISPPQDGRMGSHQYRCPTRDCRQLLHPSYLAEQHKQAPPASAVRGPDHPGSPSASLACCRGSVQGQLLLGGGRWEDEQVLGFLTC